MVDLGGVRTILTVPLCKDAAVLGLITVYRQEIRAFSDQQIALVEGFAAQAVIAMENARLITETREALEQQTATAEVLQVINSSPGDLAPVFDAMLERRCVCARRLLDPLAPSTANSSAPAAHARSTACICEFRAKIRAGSARASTRHGLCSGESVVHIADLMAAGDVPDGARIPCAASIWRCSHGSAVAAAQGRGCSGMINIYRQEVKPFTDRQIALLQNFAAQAVIAMENARLLTETREALEQQTATAEVLQVINSSPGDL